VLAEAAASFDPTEPEAIAAAVTEVLADPARFAERGLTRARELTWDACARRHDDVYEELSAA
jgi:glycosyltransferase involved in cell wall biosynthesis